MNRDNYVNLLEDYKRMRERFQSSPLVTVLWTGLLGFLLIALYFVVKSENPYADTNMFPLVNTLGVVLILSLVITLVLFGLLKQKKPCELFLSCYTFLQIIATLSFIHCMIYIILTIQHMNMGVMINIVSIFFIVIFLILCTVLVLGKVKKGEYQYNAKKTPISKKVFFWGLLALPIMPFTSMAVRRYGFNALSDLWQSVLINYMIMWFWLVIIYSYLAKNLVFIMLEIKNRRYRV